MYPDVVITHNDDVKLVADASWKTGTISQADLYQMTAYTLATTSPASFSSHNNIETSYLIDNRHQLLVRELATHLINGLHTTLTEVLELPQHPSIIYATSRKSPEFEPGLHLPSAVDTLLPSFVEALLFSHSPQRNSR